MTLDELVRDKLRSNYNPAQFVNQAELLESLIDDEIDEMSNTRFLKALSEALERWLDQP